MQPGRTTFLLLGALLATAPAASAGRILFLVAEPAGHVVHGDSYVLPLDDPDAVAHARALVASGPLAGAPIAVARIAPGADGVNRDLRAPGAPAWSWHVTGFEGFADTTIEVLDGWPGFVEQDVAGWIANTGGAIGFWSYTVVEELPEPAAERLALVSLAALAGAARRAGNRLRIAVRAAAE